MLPNTAYVKIYFAGEEKYISNILTDEKLIDQLRILPYMHLKKLTVPPTSHVQNVLMVNTARRTR